MAGKNLLTKTTVLGLIAFTLLLLQALTPATVKKDGAEPGYTGSPGDSGKNCTECHGGNAVLVDNWISSNIPDEGYTPGATYTITAYNNESGATRFGFEVSPQSISGKYLGKMIITDSVRTKIVSFSNQSGTPVEYITYTENGVDGLGESSWTFDWIAPASGTGEVTFYGGFNSNFEGHKEGDKTYLSTLTVKEKGSSIGSLSKTLLAYMHYPNPCNGPLSISFTIAKKEDVTIGLYDLQGKLVQTLFKQTVSGRQHIEVQIDQRIAGGNYAVRTKVGHKYYSEALLIQ